MNDFGVIMNRVIAQVFERRAAASQPGTFEPTFILGLGGTGCMVLRHLKRMFRELREVEVKLLAIDCDQNIDRGSRADLPPLGPDLVLLPSAPAVGLMASARAGNAPSHITDFLPREIGDGRNFHDEVERKIQEGHGAGRFRRAGRLVFEANISGHATKNLDEQIRRIHADLVGLSTQVAATRQGRQFRQGCRVFVVTSLAGGAGSGFLLDALALVRRHFSGSSDRITLIALLPGPTLDQKINNAQDCLHTYGTAAGALREMEPMVTGQLTGYTFHLGDQAIVLPPGLANEIYLVDHYVNLEHGPAQVAQLDDIFSAMAMYLYAVTGTGLGMTQDQTRINDYTQPASARQMGFQFCTLGAATLLFPSEEILEYAIHRCAHATLRDWLSGPEELTTVEAAVRASCDQTSLGDYAGALAAFPPFDPADCFKIAGGAFKNWMALPDEALLNQADSFLAEYRANRLRQHAHQMSSALQAAEAGLESLRDNALGLCCATKTMLEAFISRMRNQIDQLDRSHTDPQTHGSRAWTAQRLALLQEALEAARQEIKSKPKYLDYGARKRFHGILNEILKLHFDEQRLAHLEAYLNRAKGVLDMMRAQIEALVRDCQFQASESQIHCHEKDRSGDAQSFVVFSVPRAGFHAWLDAHNVPTNVPIRQASDFTVFGLLDASLAAVTQAIENPFDAVDLPSAIAAAPDSDLARRFRSVLGASNPLIQFTKQRPLSVVESKAIAGKGFEAANPGLADSVKAAGGVPNANMLQNSSGRMIVCTTLLKGFQIRFWHALESSVQQYYRDPFYYGSLETSVEGSLPPLVAPQDRSAWFVIGWMLDAIRRRNTGAFYLNLIPDKASGLSKPALLLSSTGVGLLTQTLVDNGLLQGADPKSMLFDSSLMIGSSLQSSIARFDGPDFDDERALIQNWWDALPNVLEANRITEAALEWSDAVLQPAKSANPSEAAQFILLETALRQRLPQPKAR